MTERKIVIKTCKECPHIDEDNQFVPPLCQEANRQLQFIVRQSEISGVGLYAKPTYEIPEWCPLAENEK